MILGWIIVRSHASGASEFYTEQEPKWSSKLSDCYIFRDKEIVQNKYNLYCSSTTDEIVNVEAYL